MTWLSSYGCQQGDIEHHVALEEPAHCPLITVIFIVRVRPSPKDGSDQVVNGAEERATWCGAAGIGHPVAVHHSADIISATLCNCPAKYCCDGARQYKPESSPECATRQASQSASCLVGSSLLDWLESVDEAAQDEKHSKPRKPFGVDANKWQVVPKDGSIFFEGGLTEPIRVAKNEVRGDDKEGSDTSEALEEKSVSTIEEAWNRLPSHTSAHLVSRCSVGVPIIAVYTRKPNAT